MTHDDLRTAVARMVSAGATPLRIAEVGTISLCVELERQGLAKQDGARMKLTGNGWHFGREHWPEWLRPTIDALIDTICEGEQEVVTMDDVSSMTLVHGTGGARAMVSHSADNIIAWSVIVHACQGCMVQCGHPPAGRVHLNKRGFIREEWRLQLDAPSWELLPIPEVAP